MSISKLPSNASLKQVMDKFEEISLQDFSSIDIITSPSLPANGKEGQVCIITDVAPNNIYLDYKKPILNETDIYIKYYNIDSYETFNVASSKKKLKLKIRNIIQKKQNKETLVAGYIYINSAWKPLIPSSIDIYKDGSISSDTGNMRILNQVGRVDISLNSSSILGKASAYASSSQADYRNSSGIITHTTPVDISSYKKIYVDIFCSFRLASINVSGGAKIGVFDLNGNIIASKTLTYVKKTNENDSLWEVDRAIQELDISNISGEYYVGVFIDCHTSYQKEYTNNCTIYRITAGGEILA